MNEVIGTDEFADWYRSLTAQEEAEVANVIGKLETLGLRLGEPHSSAIKGATFALRELRCRSGNSPLREYIAELPEVEEEE